MFEWNLEPHPRRRYQVKAILASHAAVASYVSEESLARRTAKTSTLTEKTWEKIKTKTKRLHTKPILDQIRSSRWWAVRQADRVSFALCRGFGIESIFLCIIYDLDRT